jgi:hypothetical protein
MSDEKDPDGLYKAALDIINETDVKPNDSFLVYIEPRKPNKDTFDSLAKLLIAHLDSFPLTYIPNDRQPKVRYCDDFETYLCSENDPESPKLVVCATEDLVVDYSELEKIYISKLVKIRTVLNSQLFLTSLRQVFVHSLQYLRQKEVERLNYKKSDRERDNNKKSKFRRDKTPDPQINMANKFPQGLQPTIPKFDENNVKRWLEDCKDMFLIYLGGSESSTPENQVPKLLTPFIPDFARGIHDGIKERPWVEYVEGMIGSFQSDNSMSAVRDLMLSQTRKQGESLRAYLHRVSSLGNRANPPLSAVDCCRILNQLLPPNIAMAMLGWSKLLQVPQFIDRAENIFNESKTMSATWGTDASSPGLAKDRPAMRTDDQDLSKICALLEKLTDTDKQETPLDIVAKKLDDLIQQKSKTTQEHGVDGLDERVMKIFESKYPNLAQGNRGRGRGRGGRGFGRSRYGYARGGFLPAYGGYAGGQNPDQYGYAPMVAYGQPPAPQGYQQPAIMPPPQQQRGGRGGSYQQQGVRLCYVCGDPTHLSYSCQKRNF